MTNHRVTQLGIGAVNPSRNIPAWVSGGLALIIRGFDLGGNEQHLMWLLHKRELLAAIFYDSHTGG
jgi:hypothetical protein